MNPIDKLRVHPEAALELRSARRWYRERNRKAGEAFGLEYKATRPDTFDWLPRADRGANGVNIETLRQQQETRIS